MDLFEQNDTRAMYSVSELNAEIRELLESTLPTLWVEGEISNFTHHSSGHMYFSLKDEQSQISCVMWKSRTIHFRPVDGAKVHVFGNVRVYEKRGTVQVDVIKMMPAGVGDLQMAFEALKRRLLEEGLFDAEHKQALPIFPKTIGIVTSATGAAIRDIRNVIARRYPAAKMILSPAIVQGDDAPVSIVNALNRLVDYTDIDVIIIGRGGGSLEDLWAFNDERVARAIFASNIPVVSAVGHEIDFTISDFVADLRAPTPSAAAELVVPDMQIVQQRIASYKEGLYLYLAEMIKQGRKQLDTIQTGYGFRKPADMLYQYRQRLDELEQSIRVTVKHDIAIRRQRLLLNSRRIDGLSPQSVLARGYSITRVLTSGELVRSVKDLKQQDRLLTRVADGEFISHFDEIVKSNDSGTQ